MTTTPPVSVRLPEALRARLAAAADEAHRSLNAQIVYLLEEALGPRPPDPAFVAALALALAAASGFDAGLEVGDTTHRPRVPVPPPPASAPPRPSGVAAPFSKETQTGRRRKA